MYNLQTQMTIDLDESTDLEVIGSSGPLEIDDYGEDEVIFSPDLVEVEGRGEERAILYYNLKTFLGVNYVEGFGQKKQLESQDSFCD